MRDTNAHKHVALPEIWPGKVFVRSARRTSNWCPSCGVGTRSDRVSLSNLTGTWRWYCFACGEGGTAVDMLALTERITVAEAIVRLKTICSPSMTTVAADNRPPSSHQAHDEGAFVESLRLMRQHGIDEGVAAALAARGISRQTVVLAYEAGLLITLPSSPAIAFAWLENRVGRARMQAAGLWSKRWPPAAYRPLIFATLDDGAAEFRALRHEAGVPKAIQAGKAKWPLVFSRGGTPTEIRVVEGGIDLLSVLEIDGDSAMILGLLGAGAWRDSWAERVSRKYTGVPWSIATDHDAEGNHAASRISSCLGRLGVPHKRSLPPCGKDWNDYLQFLAA